MDDPRLVPLGVLTKPHGLKGEMRLRLFNEDSEVVRPRLAVTLLPPDEGASRPAKVKAVRRGPSTLLVRLEGVETREAADALRGTHVAVPRELLGEPAADEWFVVDLEGCEARLHDERLGTVLRVQEYPTCDVLVVDRHDGTTIEIPLLEAYVGAVDVAARQVEILTVDGLE